MQAIFPPQSLAHILGEVVADAGRTQLRMAETEKYPHVTYFLNGGREEPYPGEDRIMVPSPKVATYDLQPEMSAPELTDKAVAAIDVRQIRPDRAQLRQPRHGRPHRQPAGGDQGGGDRRRRPRPHRRRDPKIRRRAPRHRRPRQLRDDARPAKPAARTPRTPPIRCRSCCSARSNRALDAEGRLADIAPTLLELMELPKPEEMTGHSLLRARPRLSREPDDDQKISPHTSC